MCRARSPTPHPTPPGSEFGARPFICAGLDVLCMLVVFSAPRNSIPATPSPNTADFWGPSLGPGTLHMCRARSAWYSGCTFNPGARFWTRSLASECDGHLPQHFLLVRFADWRYSAARDISVRTGIVRNSASRSRCLFCESRYPPTPHGTHFTHTTPHPPQTQRRGRPCFLCEPRYPPTPMAHTSPTNPAARSTRVRPQRTHAMSTLRLLHRGVSVPFRGGPPHGHAWHACRPVSEGSEPEVPYGTSRVGTHNRSNVHEKTHLKHMHDR
jgi:hypothetical protein